MGAGIVGTDQPVFRRVEDVAAGGAKMVDGDALDEIDQIQTRQRLNQVVKTGIPGFIPQGR